MLQVYLHFHNTILLRGRIVLADCKELKTMYIHKNISIGLVLNKCNFEA